MNDSLLTSDSRKGPTDRDKLSGLLGFAEGVLSARNKVQMEMQTGLGLFHENKLSGLPGIEFDCDDGTWLRIQRQKETRPPNPPEHVAAFLSTEMSNSTKRPDPDRRPVLKPAIQVDITIEEASDLVEAGLLDSDGIHTIAEDTSDFENKVRVTLHSEKLVEMRAEFEAYVTGEWESWAQQERPVRNAIAAYNDLFKIHSAIHTSEGTPPELIWGIGIGRWLHSGGRVDMPIIEQQVDIEIEDGGDIIIRPRALAPKLSLKPYLELDVNGAPKLQLVLQERLSQFLSDDNEFSPFNTVWEPLLANAASKLSSDAVHVSRSDLDEGAVLTPAGNDLQITSCWAIFGRPRSSEARVQDFAALRRKVDNHSIELPPAIKCYATPPNDSPKEDLSEFGLDSAVLGGARNKGWEPSVSGALPSSELSSASIKNSLDSGRKVHFFPLPFNLEQSKISDMIDNPELHVIGVSGPPGTGKSHSIANIISHQMALGKRVLVTARTPEAISAIREKLPESLKPLVIASVGTDRESSQQLQEAVSELSREVVGLDKEEALITKSRLENQIVKCDEIAEAADQALAAIARANLQKLEWADAQRTPMELVEILQEKSEEFNWFTDRPEKSAPAQLDEPLKRLKQILPNLAADVPYIGITLPFPEDLPSGSEIVEAHSAAIMEGNSEINDINKTPIMSLDSSNTIHQAEELLETLVGLQNRLDAENDSVKKLITNADKASLAASQKKIHASISLTTVPISFDSLAEIEKVRFELGDCSPEDFLAAANRGASGQKPLRFSLFNAALKKAVNSTLIAKSQPNSKQHWQTVVEAFQLARTKTSLENALSTMVVKNIVPEVPTKPWEIAQYVKAWLAQLQLAEEIADNIEQIKSKLNSFFPYGLSFEEMHAQLDFNAAIIAIRANLPNLDKTPKAISQLYDLADTNILPLHNELRNLADALKQESTKKEDIIRARNELIHELTRLWNVKNELDSIECDIAEVAAAGAVEWSQAIQQNPTNVAQLIPDTWAEAWEWARLARYVETIIDLGNGDEHRQKKADAISNRLKYLEQLIRIRTLLGLKGRMTGSIRSALEAFSQAISKIGTGKGKRAPRFIKAAQEAAQKASTAAPVWIMPEYKIPEQLPPELGDFDLVILDEASQSDITALAALARGKKVLVVGDEEQVSPSVVGIPDQKINALRAEYLDELPNAKLIDQNSSIFEITKRMHPDSHVMLREHFRCVAPIIQFSSRYYGNALIPLRLPKASERLEPPLIDVYIRDAVRKGKTNDSEAQWIVDEIAKIVVEPQNLVRDIGIISLIGQEQAEKIGRMLLADDRIGSEKMSAHRIIYGDARTMQGQERSIVFLSMVATPGNAHAQTTKSDQQRINVAMSRARDRLYLVRSVQKEDLRSTDIKAQILQHFSDPMPEGRIVTGVEEADLLERCDSGFERDVLKRLIQANYRVRPQVAVGSFSIDMVVEGLDDRRLAIELDGDHYHGPDVWDRDMQRQEILERAGWTFWRVFGSQWKSDQQFWWKNLLDTLESLGIQPIGYEALEERFTETVVVDQMDKSLAFKLHENATPSLESVSHEENTAASETGSLNAKSEKNYVPSDSITINTKEDLVLSSELNQGKAVEKNSELILSQKTIQIGATVKLEKLGQTSRKMVITLVENGHDVEQGLIGTHTPLGRALIGAEIGEVIEYQAGAYLREVKVLDFEL